MINPMELFNYVKCEYPLPFPEGVSEKDLPDWSEFDFQTKSFLLSSEDDEFSFMGAMDVYNIDEEGEIYREIVKREYVETKDGYLDIKETPKGIERVDFTGELVFYGTHMAEKYDYLMEFKALFWKGELKELSRLKWEKEDSFERIKKEKELEKNFKKAQEKTSSIFRNVWNKTVKFPIFIVRYILALFLKVTFKLERWFSI